MRILSITFLCILSFFLQAQKEANIWYFGNAGAGIDFNCLPPTPISGHQMNAWEGVCTVSDPNTGKLLFYTNGDKIYNAQNQVIQGGDYITPFSQNFEPFNSVSQCLAIPRPGFPQQYYIINTDMQGGKFIVGDLSQNGMWAVHLDMAQNNGSGAVIDRFQIHNPLFTTEKILGIPHANGQDIYVIGHEFGNNTFFVAKVTDNAFPATFSTYDIGEPHEVDLTDPFNNNNNAVGELKASTDGSKIASVVSGFGSVEVFDFDNGSGEITNHQLIDKGEFGMYGLSFSPDNTKLYASSWNGNLYQFDLEAGTTDDIIQSKTLIYAYTGGAFASLKIGPDNKIYVSRFVGEPSTSNGGDEYLGVINNPNALGIDCDYVHDGLFLNGLRCNWGLNNAIERINYEQIELNADLGPDIQLLPCDNNTVELNAFEECVKEYLWQDGSTAPTFSITEQGTYWVELIYDNCSDRDSILVTEQTIEEIEVLGNDTTICVGDTILINAANLGPNTSYLWQDGSTEAGLVVFAAGTYSVTISDDCNTLDDQITVNFFEGIENQENQIKVPDIFSPNGDGLNDVFLPVGLEKNPDLNILKFSMIVFNRWGQRVFQSEDPMTGWLGDFDGTELPTDTYIYKIVLEYQGCSGEISIFQKSGEIFLLR